MTTPVGHYRHLVSLVQPGTPTPDPDGGWGETWVPLTPPTWHCAIQAASLRDLQRLSGGVLSTTATHVLRGRYHPQLTRTARIQFGTRVFDVESVHDLEERQIELEVIAHEQPGAPVVALPYADQVIADGAAHYWRLGDQGGTIAIDRVGYAHGTISGGVTLNQPGALGDGNMAMTFDGVSGRVKIPAGWGNFGTGPWTVECWLRYTPKAGAFMYALESTYDAGQRVGINLFIGEAEAPNFGFEIVTSTITSFRSIVAGPTAGNGQWHLMTGVLQRAPDRLLTYLDGALSTTDPFADAGSLVITNPLNIGLRFNYSADGAYAGSIDEVAIYPRALSAAEILDHYHASGR